MMEVQTLNGENIVSETAPNKAYIDQTKPGEQRSLYGDMARSRDFGDRALWGTAQLRELGAYWKSELNNPERSPRAQKEIDVLIGRTCFELTMRDIDHVALSRQQHEEDLAWAEYEAAHPLDD